MSTLIRPLILILTCSLLVACATSPTGRQQLMLVSEESSIASSKMAYLSTVKELDNAGKLEDDWVINKRVNVITGLLVTEAIKMRPETAGWEWSVVVIDDPEMVNAWCMAGGRMTHGGHSKRRPGSIGQCAYPGRVNKGRRMPGHMGHARRTQQNLRVVSVKPEENLILIEGAVPGATGGIVLIRKALKKAGKSS